MKALNVFAATTLGILAGTLASCRQELAPSVSREAAGGTERKASLAQYRDGKYTFYFTNGNKASGDCDGYSYELPLGGRTTIFEWWQSDAEIWERRLRSAGISSESYKTSSLFQHCRVWFDSVQLIGVGKESYTPLHFRSYRPQDYAYLYPNKGGRIKIEVTSALFYAPPRDYFNFEAWELKESSLKKLAKDQKARDTPSICILFDTERRLEKAEAILRNAGIAVLDTYTSSRMSSVVIDARDVRSFNFDNGVPY
ncbi:hypothetical protein [Treponema endosymbiont of Eucomonympha sp.]|uniref:hypothetical protein n=1 Tax=Treponema endosymbiont of Eucomonympha sp. TaxID=1580831 RepID=UPI0007853B66|nr:hypothetical protein [Treponema endosymbiont of Eucomonympha sp.]